jgi:membrane protein
VAEVETRDRRGWLRSRLADWKTILVGTGSEFVRDEISTVAAGVTYSMLLAFFPAVTAFVSLYGLFADVHTVRQQLFFLRGILPPGVLRLVGNDMIRVTTTHSSQLGIAFVVSVLISLWSANWGASALMRALGIAYSRKETRGVISYYLVSLAITGGALVSCIVGIALIIALPLLEQNLGLANLPTSLRWPFFFAAMVLGIACVYRYGPDNSAPGRRVLFPGATLAAFAFLGGSILFSWYVANFAHYDSLYGPFSTIIGFMIWIWLGVVVVLVGGELNGQIEQVIYHRQPR